MRRFSEIPNMIESLLEQNKVVLIVIDGFGKTFSDRHLEHPFLQRLALEPLEAQFPTTTTAHMTTLYTGLSVAEHGLYEWTIKDPVLGCLQPLPMISAESSTLGYSLDPSKVLPNQTFAKTLSAKGFSSACLHPLAYAFSPYNVYANRGAELMGYQDLVGAKQQLQEANTEHDYVLFYYPFVDTCGHTYGPKSPEFLRASVEALDFLETATQNLEPGTKVLVCSDHGQTDLEQLDFVDDVWPEIIEQMTALPCGSTRDVFVHVKDPSRCKAELSKRMPDYRILDKTEILALFDDPGPRLLERIADVLILPPANTACSFRAFPSAATKFKGSHGGLSDQERISTFGQMDV